MGMVIKQYEIFLINLDPTVGHEIKKTRPCIVISPNEMNESVSTVIIAPITSKSNPYPTRIPIIIENKEGWIVMDQIRTVDKLRMVKKLNVARKETIEKIKAVVKEMLVD